jgi:urease accessory protein UreE
VLALPGQGNLLARQGEARGHGSPGRIGIAVDRDEAERRLRRIGLDEGQDLILDFPNEL